MTFNIALWRCRFEKAESTSQEWFNHGSIKVSLKWGVLLLEKIARPRAILKKSHFDQRYYQHQHHGRLLPYPHPTPTSAHQTTARHLLFQLCAALEDFFGPGGFIALLIRCVGGGELTQHHTQQPTAYMAEHLFR